MQIVNDVPTHSLSISRSVTDIPILATPSNTIQYNTNQTDQNNKISSRANNSSEVRENATSIAHESINGVTALVTDSTTMLQSGRQSTAMIQIDNNNGESRDNVSVQRCNMDNRVSAA